MQKVNFSEYLKGNNCLTEQEVDVIIFIILNNLIYLLGGKSTFKNSRIVLCSFSNVTNLFKFKIKFVMLKGVTDSLYLKLRARNRCNHRDYQNLSRNGASSCDGLTYVKSLARSQSQDKPALVLYGMYGNDVCNR